jgi:hypothetical protein
LGLTTADIARLTNAKTIGLPSDPKRSEGKDSA